MTPPALLERELLVEYANSAALINSCPFDIELKKGYVRGPTGAAAEQMGHWNNT